MSDTAWTIVILILMLTGLYWFLSAGCHGQWQHSGLKSEFRIPEGCMLQKPDGMWIPDKVYREVMP